MDEIDAANSRINDDIVDEMSALPPLRRPRTSEDFYLFCQIILDHEKYEQSIAGWKQLQIPVVSKNSTIDSENISNSNKTTSTNKLEDHDKEELNPATEIMIQKSETVIEDYNSTHYSITCFCGKPFAGRPMIECSKCLTWLHLKCARIKRSKIPEIFNCYKCKFSNRGRDSLNRHKEARKINSKNIISSSRVTSTTPEHSLRSKEVSHRSSSSRTSTSIKISLNTKGGRAMIKSARISTDIVGSSSSLPMQETNTISPASLPVTTSSRQSILSFEKKQVPQPQSIVRVNNSPSVSSSTNQNNCNDNFDNGDYIIANSDNNKIQSINNNNSNKNNNISGDSHNNIIRSYKRANSTTLTSPCKQQATVVQHQQDELLLSSSTSSSESINRKRNSL